MNQCKMERIPQMKEVIGGKADSLMNVRLKYIENLLESEKNSVRKDLELALEQLMAHYIPYLDPISCIFGKDRDKAGKPCIEVEKKNVGGEYIK